MIDVGERSYSGIPGIFYVWKSNDGMIRKLRSLLNLNGYPYCNLSAKPAIKRKAFYVTINAYNNVK